MQLSQSLLITYHFTLHSLYFLSIIPQYCTALIITVAKRRCTNFELFKTDRFHDLSGWMNHFAHKMQTYFQSGTVFFGIYFVISKCMSIQNCLRICNQTADFNDTYCDQIHCHWSTQWKSTVCEMKCIHEKSINKQEAKKEQRQKWKWAWACTGSEVYVVHSSKLNNKTLSPCGWNSREWI